MVKSGKWKLVGYGVMDIEGLKQLELEKRNGYTSFTYGDGPNEGDLIGSDESYWIE